MYYLTSRLRTSAVLMSVEWCTAFSTCTLVLYVYCTVLDRALFAIPIKRNKGLKKGTLFHFIFTLNDYHLCSLIHNVYDIFNQF